VNKELKNRRDYRMLKLHWNSPFHWLDIVGHDFQVTTRRIGGVLVALGIACVSEGSPSRLGVEFVLTIISESKLVGGYFLLCIKFSGWFGMIYLVYSWSCTCIL